ncbi:TY-Chap domain-containing protein [Arthrobacter sp. UYCu723]
MDIVRAELTTAGSRSAPGYWTRPEALVEAYRRGDPLRAIAHDYDGSVLDICEALIDKTLPDNELERLRSVRQRGQTTMGSIWDNVEMITRLDDSGIKRSEIPVVLRAIGTEIDVEVAVELLHVPGIPGDDPTILQDPILLCDKLSLLYVTGKHHGIEPDYQLTLGQMPTAEIAELRLLTRADFPPRRFAEILAVAETTKLAIRARVARSLSVEEYVATAEPLARRFRGHILDEAAAWPTPVSALTRRLGGGCWDQALSKVGLQLRKAADRFGETDFIQAIQDYGVECADCDFPVSLETYDRWVTAEVSLGGDRPSAIELMVHYGGWQEALSTIPGYEAKQQLPAPNSDSIDAALLDRTDSALEAAWVRVGEYVCELLASMPRNRSLLIHYGDCVDGSIPPFAEGIRGVDGVWCEVVSERLLPGEQWPIDTDYLEDEDWLAPDDEVPQWCKEKVALHEAGHQLLKGLRFGRLCPDPWQLRWGTKQPIGGPGRDHGVTMEQALAGEVQTLRNAG